MWYHIICLVTLSLFIPTLGSYCASDNSYLIRNKYTGYVFDASEKQVRLQAFDGYAAQLWRFECANTPGTFYIVNNNSKNVLDVDISTIDKSTVSVIVNVRGGSLYQEWYINSNGTIVNAQLNQMLCTSGSDKVGVYLLLDKTGIGNMYETFIAQEMKDYFEKN